jgi:hypothetical protein
VLFSPRTTVHHKELTHLGYRNLEHDLNTNASLQKRAFFIPRNIDISNGVSKFYLSLYLLKDRLNLFASFHYLVNGIAGLLPVDLSF